jgi:hypothetical protein
MQFDLYKAEQEKEKGMKLVMEKSKNQEVVDILKPHAIAISIDQGFCSSDDLRKYAHQENISVTTPKAWGAICKRIFSDGWVHLGYKKSEIVSSHGREIKTWRFIG